MSTSTTASPANYRIVSHPIIYGTFAITGPGALFLRDKWNNIRSFATRNSARKRIARERSGNFHR